MTTPWVWKPVRDGWFPPQGAVRMSRTPASTVALDCTACQGLTTAPTVGDAHALLLQHRCPPGTPSARPRCPECGEAGPRCISADASSTLPDWHPARTQLVQDTPPPAHVNDEGRLL